MKKIAILSILMGLFFSAQSFADSANVLTGNLKNHKGTFNQGAAISFTTNINKSLVIQCNGAYGLIGLSDKSYVAYNRVQPAVKTSSKACYNAIKAVKSGYTLSFFWKKTSECGYFGCKYLKAYSLSK